jgi:translation initiation factor 2 beta subunit (eIF-2beta)/eIF-5
MSEINGQRTISLLRGRLVAFQNYRLDAVFRQYCGENETNWPTSSNDNCVLIQPFSDGPMKIFVVAILRAFIRHFCVCLSVIDDQYLVVMLRNRSVGCSGLISANA